MMGLLQKKRLEYRPEISEILKTGILREKKEKHAIPDEVRKYFPKTCDQQPFELVSGKAKQKPLRIGVVFSGGQAAGGHNVIAGIWDALHEGSRLFGFLDGPSGIVENQVRELKQADIDAVRNLGGFDLLGSGRTKIETQEQLKAVQATCQAHQLDGLIVIGGDDSNTNAAVLAEYLGSSTRVIGVPKTIDGDLQSKEIEISFGFDSACKTYSEMIGNISRDALSAKKYYHFIKLMGRSASHITLECALATQPNLTLIGEERKSLPVIVKEIADLIRKRAEAGKEYGIILIPEGLIEFIPDMKLPDNVPLDPHGNVALSQIETERFLIDLVKKETKFSAVSHFFGYEGRACLPSNFDAKYCYALGRLAVLAVRDGLTGMICSVQNLAQPVEKWRFTLAPIVRLIHMEERKGQMKPVIEKALVDLQGPVFHRFATLRDSLKWQDAYTYPGPMQFFGDKALTDSVPRILQR